MQMVHARLATGVAVCVVVSSLPPTASHPGFLNPEFRNHQQEGFLGGRGFSRAINRHPQLIPKSSPGETVAELGGRGRGLFLICNLEF